VGRTRPGDAGAKVLKAASTLFYRDGIHAVGVDTVAAEAGVTTPGDRRVRVAW